MQAARSHGNLTFVFIQINTNNMHLMPLPNLCQSQGTEPGGPNAPPFDPGPPPSHTGPAVRAAYKDIRNDSFRLVLVPHHFSETICFRTGPETMEQTSGTQQTAGKSVSTGLICANAFPNTTFQTVSLSQGQRGLQASDLASTGNEA